MLTDLTAKILFLLLCFSLTACSFADDLNAEFFVKNPQGVRAQGMANAFCAVSDDPLAMYWNPAGLADMREMTLTSSHSVKYGSEMSGNYVLYIYPIEKIGTLGLGYFDQVLDDVMVLGNHPDEMRNIADTQRSLCLSYAYQANERWLVGFNLKHLSEKNTISANGMECDAGLQYKGKRYLDFGFSISDWFPTDFTWTTGRKEQIPATIRTGFLYHSPENRFKAAIDTEYTDKCDSSFHLGSEYEINKLLSIRGGYETGGGVGVVSAGFGLSHQNWVFDYTWSNSDLGGSSVFGATLYFDHPRKKNHTPRSEQLIGSELSEIKKEVRQETIKEQATTSSMDEIVARYRKNNYTYEKPDNAKPEAPADIVVQEASMSAEAKEHFDLGNVYLLRKMYNKAIEEYLKTIELEPNFAKVHFNLAAIYQKIDMDEKAIYEYRFVLQLEPDNLNALLALGNLYSNKGLTDKAVIYYNKVIVLAPHSLQADVARKRLGNL
ncbi:MAG: PorV/PorQ family protein [Candidatus Wallbacteria bacterium]|nr:PorV/PorQ family protein [Candidatus Wallbacteria bacterium]